MIRHHTLAPDRALALVIDLQDKLLPAIYERERVIHCTRKLLEGLQVFNVPVIVTEQYPKGLGSTDASVLNSLGGGERMILEKPSFSACGSLHVRDAVNRIDRPQIIIAGIEAHVCVQQSALDLRVMDYDVFVCADAVGSRGRVDYEQALLRLRQEGVYVTTVESVLFELCGRCDSDAFKKMLNVIKAYPPA